MWRTLGTLGALSLIALTLWGQEHRHYFGGLAQVRFGGLEWRAAFLMQDFKRELDPAATRQWWQLHLAPESPTTIPYMVYPAVTVRNCARGGWSELTFAGWTIRLLPAQYNLRDRLRALEGQCVTYAQRVHVDVSPDAVVITGQE